MTVISAHSILHLGHVFRAHRSGQGHAKEVEIHFASEKKRLICTKCDAMKDLESNHKVGLSRQPN